jgi:hypothetical protein
MGSPQSDHSLQYCTQSADKLDNDIYSEISAKLGQLDRISFENELLHMYEDDEDKFKLSAF